MKRLTPIDIFNKDFKRSLGGYSKAEVNEFLDQVIKTLEEVLQENQQLRQKMERMETDAILRGRTAGPPSSLAAKGSLEMELSRPPHQHVGAERESSASSTAAQRLSSSASSQDPLTDVAQSMEHLLRRLERLERNFERLRR